jgi:exodeoxyribonuclease V alpha subunit
MIRGIGPVYARKMVRGFGEKVFDIIEADPDRLREVDGIPLLRIHVSPQRGQNRRSLARSWCFCTATGWGRLVRFGSSRLMASMPLRDRLKTADAISIRLGIQKTAMVRFAPASRMH